MEEGGLLASEYEIRYSPNAIVVANAAARPGKVCTGIMYSSCVRKTYHFSFGERYWK